MIKHYLNFVSSGHGRIEILEPEGFQTATFGIEQGNGRKGRDVVYAGGNSQKLTIYDHSHHKAFDIFLYNRDRYGSEAVIKYEVKLAGDIIVLGEIEAVVTDRVSYIEFTVIEESEKALLKRRIDIKTNLFSYKTLDDADITPVNAPNVFVPAKPIIQVSTWKAGAPLNVTGAIAIKFPGSSVPFITTDNRGTNLSNALIQYDLQDSLSFISPQTSLTGGIPNLDTFTYLRAKENIQNLVIELTNVDLTVYSTKDDSEVPSIIDAYGYSKLVVRKGVTLEESVIVEFLHTKLFGNESSAPYQFPSEFTCQVGLLKRNECIWIYIENKVDVDFTDTNVNASYSILNLFQSMDVKITGTSVAYSTIAPMVNLHDAMEYNIRSVADLPISAPRWALGGELHDQYITTQSLMRNLTDKPFNLSFKDIVDDYLPEVNGDYQIQEDGTVFIGAADESVDDFYKDYQIAEFTQEELSSTFGQPEGQIEGFEESDNEKFMCIEFQFNYSNFASQKENEQANTFDLVHGESQWMLYNKKAEGIKEVKVGWIRDAFLIEQARRKAYDLQDSTATQDDDKIYIVDVVAFDDSKRFIVETSTVRHEAVSNEVLVLKNDLSFSWVLLGISPGSPFIIQTGDNAGGYIVISLTANELRLAASAPPENIEEENTTYQYFVSPLVAQLAVRTSEGFADIDNIEDGRNYANLRFTNKRNIRKRYNSYLATCVSKTASKEIKNTKYKNNPEALTTLTGETIPTVEGETFVPTNPILTKNLFKVNILMKLSRFTGLRTLQRLHNGYITVQDPSGLPLKGYIQNGAFRIINAGGRTANDYVGIMETTLEEKYQEFLMTIFGTGGGEITINGTIPVSNFDIKIDKFEKLSIFGGNGKLMYPPVPYDRVKVNNSGQASSPFELIQWLNALQA